MECTTNCVELSGTPTPPQTTKQSQTRVWRGQKQRQCPLARVHPLCCLYVDTCPSPSQYSVSLGVPCGECVPWCPPQLGSKCPRWTQLPVSSLPLLDNGMARVKVADRDKCRSRSVPITFTQVSKPEMMPNPMLMAWWGFQLQLDDFCVCELP